MATRDLTHNVSSAISIAPVSITGATTGTGVDLSGYESAALQLISGAQGGTSPVLTLTLQESSDNSAWNNVPDAQVIAANGATVLSGVNSTGFTIAASSAVQLGYIGAKRYIRASLALAGTSPTAVVSGTVLLGNARNRPNQAAELI